MIQFSLPGAPVTQETPLRKYFPNRIFTYNEFKTNLRPIFCTEQNTTQPPNYIYIYIYIYMGFLNIHGTHVIDHNSNNNVFFFVSDLKLLFYNNY